tara:strand:+ start:8916 stop:10352 length:1437 start_codon:yes stop_codon:yes gene_type:complete
VKDISIVIVNFNSGPFLRVCLDSVIESDCDYEIIVIDNGSTDSSLDFINHRSYNNVITVRNNFNVGFSTAVNQAITYCNGRNILFLNPDCLIFPHTASSMCKLLDEDDSIGIIGGLVFNFDGSEQQGCRRKDPTLIRSLNKKIGFSNAKHLAIDFNRNSLPKNKVVVDAVSGAFFAIKRETFLSVRGMDEDFFLHFEDLDLCRRIREIGKNVVFTPNISIFHYQGASKSNSISFVSKEKHKSMLLYQQKYNKHVFLLRWLLFGIVWSHYFFEKMKNTKVLSSKDDFSSKIPCLDLSNFPYAVITSIKFEENRLLVFGVSRQQRIRISRSSDEINVSIYWTADCRGARDRCGEKVLCKEYFEKVPYREAFRFNSLLLAPNHNLSDDQIIQIVNKCAVKKVALFTRDLGGKSYTSDGPLRQLEVHDSKYDLINRLLTNGVLKSNLKLMPIIHFDNKPMDAVKPSGQDKKIIDCMAFLSGE